VLPYTCKLVRFVYAERERDFAYLALNTYNIIVVDAELRPSSYSNALLPAGQRTEKEAP
jgi:hypothetical protein